jgi:hypothetical protein
VAEEQPIDKRTNRITRQALQRPFGAKIYNVSRESDVDGHNTSVAGEAAVSRQPISHQPISHQPRQLPNPPSVGSEMSGFSNSSTLTSLNVITRTFFTKRAGRYISHTHASCISTSK